jgi:hypothetical protein
MSLRLSLIWLTAAVLLTWGVAGGFASPQAAAGWKAASVAAAVCWLSGGLAILVMAWWKKQNLPIQGILSAIGVRTFLPLGAGVFLSSRGGELAEAGVFGLIVIFYLVTLVVDTIVSVKMIAHSRDVPVSRNVNPG